MAGIADIVTVSGPRRKRIRWSPCRKSISARSCSFINSMNLRTFRTSKTSPGMGPEFELMQCIPAGNSIREYVR